MRERWRKWRSGLSHQTKVLGNLVLTAVLLFGLWAYSGYPLPTAELYLRRLERQNLLKTSELVLNMPDDVDGDELVSLGEDYVVTLEAGRGGGWWRRAYWYERNKEGVTPVFTAGYYAWLDPEETQWRTIRGVVVPDMPEGVERSELAIRENGELHRFEGERQERGAWLFPVHGIGTTFSDYVLDRYTYELTAYDGQGQLLLRQEGTLGKGDWAIG